jgi:hypothetical protein
MEGSWGTFPSTDQARIRSALGLSELPDPGQLSTAQLQKLDQVFGYTISVAILAFDALRKLEGKTGDTASEPLLEKPNLGDASDLAMMLATIQEKLGRLQLGTAQEGIKISKAKVETLSQQRLEKIKETLGKMQNANTTGLVGKILGWVGAIVGVAVSLVAFVASVAIACVTGVGVLAAVAAGIGLGVALAGLGMMILQETGAMEKIMEFCSQKPMSTIALMALFGVPVGVVLAILDQCGVLKEDQIAMALQVGIAVDMLAISVATMIMSAGASAGSGSAALVGVLGKLFGDSAKMVADGISNTAKLVNIGAQFFNAGVAISGGAVGIATSIQNFEVTQGQAESKEFQAWLTKLQSRLDEEQEELKKVFESLQSDMSLFSELLGNIDKSKQSIIGRMGTA